MKAKRPSKAFKAFMSHLLKEIAERGKIPEELLMKRMEPLPPPISDEQKTIARNAATLLMTPNPILYTKVLMFMSNVHYISVAEIAQEHRVSRQAIYKIIKHWEDKGYTHNRKLA
jgi:hypothetical protein